MLGPFVEIGVTDVNLPFTIATDASAIDDRPPPAGKMVGYYHPTYGSQVYRIVYNDTGATLVAYRAVSYDVGSNIDVVLATTNDPQGTVAGVPQVDIPDGHYGYVLVHGVGLGESENAIAAGARVRITAATGVFDDTAMVADAGEIMAVATIAATGAAEDIQIRFMIA